MARCLIFHFLQNLFKLVKSHPTQGNSRDSKLDILQPQYSRQDSNIFVVYNSFIIFMAAGCQKENLVLFSGKERSSLVLKKGKVSPSRLHSTLIASIDRSSQREEIKIFPMFSSFGSKMLGQYCRRWFLDPQLLTNICYHQLLGQLQDI